MVFYGGTKTGRKGSRDISRYKHTYIIDAVIRHRFYVLCIMIYDTYMY